MEEKKNEVKIDTRKDENGKNIYSFDLKKLSNSSNNNSSSNNNKDKIKVYAFEIPISKADFSLDNYDSFEDILDDLDLDDENKNNLKEELKELIDSSRKTIKNDFKEETNSNKANNESLESLIKRLANSLNETSDKLSEEDKSKLEEYLNKKKSKLNEDLDLSDEPKNKKKDK